MTHTACRSPTHTPPYITSCNQLKKAIYDLPCGRIYHGKENAMQTLFRRCLSLLLICALLVGTVPFAFATEISPEATETVEPTATVLPEEAAIPEDATPGESTEAVSNDIAAYASTQNSILLFDYTDNGDYTTRLNS